jgi:hypothetical protein
MRPVRRAAELGALACDREALRWVMRLLLGATLLWVCIGCSSYKTSYITPVPDKASEPRTIAVGRAPTATEREEIREAVFRQMCRPRAEELDLSHHVNLAHKVYFLAVDSWNDPSPALLKRFGDLKARVRPISCATNRGGFIVDRETGQRGAAFCVSRVSVQSPTGAEVAAILDPGGPLQASGPAFRLAKNNGRWTVVSSWLLWIL